jgi:hypothetical protein
MILKHIEIVQATLKFRFVAGLFMPLSGRSSFLFLEVHDFIV